ncbi:hypothetical protein [Ectopseudomonas khazarica]|uniref:hypothetical protein n=1 Tax=Ectopseudomonas khazarica TaxID=2502979 RepID=UPI00106E4D4D|nr:hypothetical protein [Pseudomonas khazarica]
MDALLELAWGTFKSAVPPATLVLVVAWLCRAWIGERLKASVRHEYDQRLELLKAQGDANLAILKSEMDRQAEKMRIAAASFSEVQKATIARKIEAVDALWRGVIELRDAFPSDVFLTDIFTDEEMQGFYTDAQMLKYSAGMERIDELAFFKVGFEAVQLVRPHLGEYTWALYSTYKALLGRSIFLIKKGKSAPDKLAWHNDANIKQMIESAFGAERFAEFENLKGGRYRWLSYQFDILLFQAIDKLLTGKSFGDAALEQALEMEKQIMDGKLQP